MTPTHIPALCLGEHSFRRPRRVAAGGADSGLGAEVALVQPPRGAPSGAGALIDRGRGRDRQAGGEVVALVLVGDEAEDLAGVGVLVEAQGEALLCAVGGHDGPEGAGGAVPVLEASHVGRDVVGVAPDLAGDALRAGVSVRTARASSQQVATGLLLALPREPVAAELV